MVLPSVVWFSKKNLKGDWIVYGVGGIKHYCGYTKEEAEARYIKDCSADYITDEEGFCYMVSKCVICGAELPVNMTQITFATEDKGIESACMKHEFSKELKDYIKRNGGAVPILDVIRAKQGDD